MARDSSGFLKPEALRAGYQDQFAVERDGKRHEVSIIHDVRQGGVVVQHITITEDVREVHAWQVGDKMPLARARFRSIVRSLGGRA
jgi:hypothetical protein